MPRIEVRPIALPAESEPFIRFPWKVYVDDPQWVPPLLMDRRKFLDPGRNPYFKVADVQCFVARRDGEIVGTISAQVDHGYQEVDKGVGFFGFFEFVEDDDVARALLETACDWLREKGMERACGPFNFNSNHDFGLLIDGFDTPPCIANPHARPYYAPTYERMGLKPRTDWYAYWMDAGPLPEQVNRVSERFMKRHPEVTLRPADMRNFEREVSIFRDIYNDAWEDNWGHVHLSEEEFQALAADFKQVIDPRLVWVAEVNGEPAALSLTLPDFNQVFKKMNGRIFPFGWYHFLFGRRRIDALRVFILGVKRKYQRMPLGAPLYIKTWEEGLKRGVRGAEASLILHDNFRMRGALEKLGARIYKTYRVYERELVEAEAVTPA